MSKSFEQIFSESNPHGFSSYEGPCTCCQPKPTDKVTKAYARGVQDERERFSDDVMFIAGQRAEQERIINILKIEEKLLYDQAKLEGSYLVTKLIGLIKGENK